MKKKTIIISSIILLLIIGFSIFNKNKTEYALIELTSEELLNTFLDEKVSITFALYNEKDIQAEDYYNDLKKVVAQARENIYYVNTNFITSEFEQVMDAAFGTDTTSQSYYVIQDGNLIINNTYQGFNTMYKELNGKKYNTEIVETSREKKLEYLEEAKKYYQEGNIATAYNYLANAWNIPEAKEEYKNNPYYKLIGSWEMANVHSDNEKMDYTNLVFLKFNSYLYTGTKTDKIDGFEKPPMNEYILEEIQIKNDKVYIKNKKTNKYEATYDIIKIEEYNITLQKGKKVMELRYGY